MPFPIEEKYITLILTCLLFACSGPEKESISNQSLDSYNVVWTSQSNNSSESMPLVGGDIGCNVWVENGDLLLYVMRSGSLSENGEYLKMGRFRIQLSPNPFELGNEFRQELKLRDGYIEVEGKTKTGEKTLVKLWVDVFSPQIHIEIDSKNKTQVIASYENWRTQDWELEPGKYGERFTCFSMSGYPGKVFRVKDEIQLYAGGIMFYHANPEDSISTDKLIKQQGLEESANQVYQDLKHRKFGGVLFGEKFQPAGTDSGSYIDRAYKSWKIGSTQDRKQHHLTIATHIDQIEDVEDWKADLKEQVKQTTGDSLTFNKTVDWWNNFWDRSYITINPDTVHKEDSVWQIGRNYNLFRYLLGGNISGEYPTKFNGGSLNFDSKLVDEEKNYGPDYRNWGGAYHTAQNQRLLYWPMLKAGDFDLTLPQFNLYVKALPGATARVKTHFGHDGALFSEYAGATGLVWGAGWGWPGESHRGRGEEFSFGLDSMAKGSGGYGKPVEQGVMTNQSCQYHWESQVEHAYMIMEYHRFSGRDISSYMPFIKSAIIFFDQHYQLRQKKRNGETLDENGKLVLFPSTNCESYRGAKNPGDLISGLRATLKSLLDLDEKYVTQKEKKYFKEFLDRVPAVPFSEQDGKRMVMPAESWTFEGNVELSQFYPLFPFDNFKIGDEEIQYFKNAYEVAPEHRKNFEVCWSQKGIQFARMGMPKEAGDFLKRKLSDSERRFPTFWGPGPDWVPDMDHGGSGMIGLQEMLMQTIGNQILLFPAWPKEWDVDFKLHAPYQTTIEAKLRNGEVKELVVTPKTREADVKLMLN